MTAETRRHRILFVCRHNAVRSQIAEALTRAISHAGVDVSSAGVEPTSMPVFVNDWVRNLYGVATHLEATALDDVDHHHFDTPLCDKSHVALPEHPEDRSHIRWDFHYPDDEKSLRQLEIELADPTGEPSALADTRDGLRPPVRRSRTVLAVSVEHDLAEEFFPTGGQLLQLGVLVCTSRVTHPAGPALDRPDLGRDLFDFFKNYAVHIQLPLLCLINLLVAEGVINGALWHA